jgi:micrococcal nuclease
MKHKKLGTIGIAFVLLVSSLYMTLSNAGEAPKEAADPYIVARVVDGDTLEVKKGEVLEKIRLIGVDTPETVKPNTPVQPYGKEARDYTKKMLLNKEVRLEFDVGRTDRYGRLLAYVYLGDEMFNETLLREGYARLMTVSPNVKYADRFVAIQKEAREAGAGLWALPESKAASAQESKTEKIDINKGTQAQLESLEGIGPALARRIMEYRDKTKFTKIEDIMKVTGVKEDTFNKIKASIKI